MSDVDTTETDQSQAPRARRPWWVKVLIGVGVLVVVIVVSAVALFYFGGPSGSANDPEMKQRYEELVRTGQVAPVDKRFTIPIPGCQCHSDDPYLTEQHRYRHMNECMDCHG